MNYVGIVVAALAAFVVGFIWYSDAVFGKAWRKLSGITPAMMKKAKKEGMGKQLALGFASMLVMAYVLWQFLGMSGANDVASNVQVAFWAWLGFMMPLNLGSYLWERKPFNLFVMNTVHWLVALIVMGTVFAFLG